MDAKTFGWLLPFAVVGLPAGLAMFTAAGLALARAMWTRGPSRVLALAVALTVVEWLRGHLLTGFPWNAYGYALTGPLVLAQSAALVTVSRWWRTEPLPARSGRDRTISMNAGNRCFTHSTNRACLSGKWR